MRPKNVLRPFSLKIPLIVLTLFLCFLFPGDLNAQAAYDWHIANAVIVDGMGSDAYQADLLIAADSISFIGAVGPDTVEATNFVDANGKVLAPGFIDAHAHGDPQRTPEFKNFLAMGVTTILLGQDGSSPTGKPLDSWFDAVQHAGPGVNIATLSGHASIRNAAGVGNQPATAQEMTRMRSLLEADFEAGSFGMSTGLEYVPGMYADRTELQHLAETVGKHGGILMSHMRSEDDGEIESSIQELASMGDQSKVHVSHLKVVYGEGSDRAEEVLAFMDSFRTRGIDISADTYPYAASYTGIGIVFPDWAKTEPGWKQALKERPAALRQYLTDKVMQRNGPESILFGSGEYAGKTLKDVANEAGRPFVDMLLEMGPQAASAAHFVMNEQLQDRIAIDSEVMISSDGSPTMRHPRGYGSFAKVIRRYVNEKESLTIEEAVYKMSGLPAATIGLEKRGRIRVGAKADLLLFDPENVKDKATFENPHLLAEGMEWVWVNGKPARKKGIFNKQRFGKVLKKGMEQ